MPEKTDYLEKTHDSYNSYYRLYKAEWCRKSGLPMYEKKQFFAVEAERLYSISRAKKEKVQIDTSTVCGWYRMHHGYTPLFKSIEKEAKK